jgi:2-desacetyl-2-hydroxyethyl bacteriochlorophyllide A dehydrogenase
MKAAVWYGGHDLRIEERPKPEIGPNEVLVQVAVCAVCATDVHTTENLFPLYTPPRVLGHEFSGWVAELGPEVHGLEVGERVAIDPGGACGQCHFCWRGDDHLCTRRRLSSGAFCEYSAVTASGVHRIPDGIDMSVAALAEPLACALHALDLVDFRPGGSAAVIGAGAIGLMLVQLVRLQGASRVIVSEPNERRRAVAAELGADIVVDPSDEDVSQAVQDATDGHGVNLSIEAVGLPETITQCIALAQRGGTALLVGVARPEDRIQLRPYDLYYRELCIRASFMRTKNFERAIALMPRLDLARLVSHEFALDRVADAIDCAKRGEGIKAIVRPH